MRISFTSFYLNNKLLTCNNYYGIMYFIFTGVCSHVEQYCLTFYILFDANQYLLSAMCDLELLAATLVFAFNSTHRGYRKGH